MSRTLFWYIARDLLRIFVMASLTLAGIMAFGGLLRPLMEYGLSGTQVVRMLLYFMPATQTYSLPIAALFATTIVYGRLAADNELTACRASGISYTALVAPAFVLGLVLAILSLASLSFIVPHYTLKVEQVAFSSIADVVRKNIQRTHQVKFSGHVIHAAAAEILPPLPDRPFEERVVLYNPIFSVTEQVSDETGKSKYSIPTEFYTARSATLYIRQGPDQGEFFADLQGGVKFPRRFDGAAMGGIGAAQVGPLPIPSIIKENTKFMNITQLKALYRDPLRSRVVRQIYNDLTRQEQEAEFVADLHRALRQEQEYRFEGAGGEAYLLRLEGDTRRAMRDGRIKALVKGRPRIVIESVGAERDVRVEHVGSGFVDQARSVTIDIRSDLVRDRLGVELDLGDALVGAGEETRTLRPAVARPTSIAMPQDIAAIKARGPEWYLKKTNRVDEKLNRRLLGLHSGIAAEIHGRASFAVSCLILVTVGSLLGMMFRTGNYLNAFALSVIPALLCIALVVTGQHVSEADSRNLTMGLWIIWSGNAIVLALAVTLLARMRRQ